VADVASYVDLSGFYAKDKFNVYRDWGTTDGRHISVIAEADVATFTVIRYRLGRDKNHVFYQGKIVEGINVAALVLLCEKPSSAFSSSYALMKDDKSVFYNRWKMETIDTETFECVAEDSTIIYRDKDWIYQDDYFPSMDSTKRTKRD
jgi:hypothetical protein